MEASYILFQTGKVYFLVLMKYVDVIYRAGAMGRQDVPVYDLARVCGSGKREGKCRFMLLLQTESLRFGIITDMVWDVVKIKEEDILSLEGPAQWEKNRYLSGVAWTGKPEQPAMYKIDVSALYEKASRFEPDYLF